MTTEPLTASLSTGNLTMNDLPTPKYHIGGEKVFELSDHLGNVLVALKDVKTVENGSYTASVLSAQDYYPFGMTMPGRSESPDDYRYGFNGKEKDSEGLGGGGATYGYGFRIYNPNLGRFLSEDPLTKKYPELTPYQFASNTPIMAIDLDGLEAFYVHGTWSSPDTWSALEKENYKTIKDAFGNETHHRLDIGGLLNIDKDRQRAADVLIENI